MEQGLLQFLPWYAGGVRQAVISWTGLTVCRLRELVGRAGEDYARIIVLQSGGLGDAVLTLPVINGLRRRWPRARLAVVAGKLGREVFDTFAPGLTVYAPGAENNVFEPEPQLIVHLRGGFQAVRAAWKNPFARFVCGLPRRSRLRWAPLYYLGLPAPRSREHQYDTFRQMMRPLGIDLPDGPRLKVRREWQDLLADKLRSKGIAGRRLAVVHPFGKWGPRAWPWDRWKDICTHLHQTLNLEICLVGGPEDVVTLRHYGPAPVPLNVFSGELSLGELAALCARAELFLGNDSGPAHLAAAAGAPCVVLYGPQDSALFGVRSSKAVAVQGRSFCTPCWQTVCPFGRARCLESISLFTVQEAVRFALAIQG